MFRRLLSWLEDCTGDEIPASSGWPQVLGSVALFAFLVQAATGLLLARSYVPAPVEAYDSLRHIVTQLTAGRLLRGLHHWGASLMIIVVVLHLIQTFIWGSYKKPREATWIAGVLLLLLTFAFGFSGYLLPWDNRAYWGTLVANRIAARAPVAGLLIARLLGNNGTSIGAVTFTRFYMAHVQLLPLFTALLIALHVYLARRQGVDENLPKKRFYPEQVAKDTMAIFGWFIVLMGMALLARVPLGHMADPRDLSYIARPQWYFLFLCQFLKWFDGPLKMLGAVILPTLAIVALILVPFIDRRKMKTVRRRWGAIGFTALAAIFWGGLTALALATAPQSREMDMLLVESWQQIPAADLASIGFFRKAQCGSCHVPGKSGSGPDLTLAPSARPEAWLVEHIQSKLGSPESLTGDQVKMLAAFVARRGAQAADAWQNAPQSAVEGALIYQANDCGTCHKLNGVGDELGPPLNGVGERRDRSWIEQHFADPPKYSPDSIMPPFDFKPGGAKLITDYIMAIPK